MSLDGTEQQVVEEIWFIIHLGDVQEIGQLKRLTELDISENQLVHLPPELGGLVSITDLCLSFNHLEELPDSIGMMTSDAYISVYFKLKYTSVL